MPASTSTRPAFFAGTVRIVTCASGQPRLLRNASASISASKRADRPTGSPRLRPMAETRARRETPAGGVILRTARGRAPGSSSSSVAPPDLDPLLERAAVAAVVLGEDLHGERRKPAQAVDVDDPGLALGVLEVDGDGEGDGRREGPSRASGARPGRSRRGGRGAARRATRGRGPNRGWRRAGLRSSPRGPGPARRRRPRPPRPRPPGAATRRRRLPRRRGRRWTRSWSDEVVTNSSRGSVAGSPAYVTVPLSMRNVCP